MSFKPLLSVTFPHNHDAFQAGLRKKRKSSSKRAKRIITKLHDYPYQKRQQSTEIVIPRSLCASLKARLRTGLNQCPWMNESLFSIAFQKTLVPRDWRPASISRTAPPVSNSGYSFATHIHVSQSSSHCLYLQLQQVGFMPLTMTLLNINHPAEPRTAIVVQVFSGFCLGKGISEDYFSGVTSVQLG